MTLVRLRRKQPLDKFAQRIGCSVDSLWAIERREAPADSETVKRISDALAIHPSLLFSKKGFALPHGQPQAPDPVYSKSVPVPVCNASKPRDRQFKGAVSIMRQRRLAAGLTLGQLGLIVHLGLQTCGLIEKRRQPLRNTDKILAIASALNCKPEDLFHEDFAILAAVEMPEVA